MRTVVLDVTTDSGGDATSNGVSVLGSLFAIRPVPGTLDSGGTFTLYSGLDVFQNTLFQQTGITGTTIYPRTAEASAVDGSGLSSTTMPLVSGNVSVVVSSGGDTVSGSFILYILESPALTMRVVNVSEDTGRPTVAITTSESDPTANSPFSITVTFSEGVTGFVVGDLVVGNGAAGNFAVTDTKTYTADITPTAPGAVTVDIAADSCVDTAGNGNFAAPQFSITYTP